MLGAGAGADAPVEHGSQVYRRQRDVDRAIVCAENDVVSSVAAAPGGGALEEGSCHSLLMN